MKKFIRGLGTLVITFLLIVLFFPEIIIFEVLGHISAFAYFILYLWFIEEKRIAEKKATTGELISKGWSIEDGYHVVIEYEFKVLWTKNKGKKRVAVNEAFCENFWDGAEIGDLIDATNLKIIKKGHRHLEEAFG